MVNPHWDETINEDITVTDLPPWSPQQEWGDVGGGGEFTGWKGQEDPPSYRSDWQDYPADEFTGIQSNVPSGGGFLRNIFEKFGGNLGRLGGGFETPYGGGLLPWLNDDWGNKGRSLQEEELMEKRKYDKYLEFMHQNQNRFNPEPGPWNEFNPRSRYGNVIEQDWGEDLLAKIYTSDMPGMQDPGFFWDSITPEAKAINTILNMPGMKEMRQGSVDDWNYEDFREKVPQYLWDQLPEGAFETLFDFRNQQPITVI